MPIRDPACSWECRVSECQNDAYDAARACAATACPAETAAYESACATGEPTDECRAAREALLTCSASCWDQLEAESATCRQQFESCLSGCAAIDRTGKDAACSTSCLSGGRTCVSPARQAAGRCHESSGCRDLRAAARAACRAGRTSEACATARDAARACFRGCKAPFIEAAAGCFDTTKSCVDTCPPTATE